LTGSLGSEARSAPEQAPSAKSPRLSDPFPITCARTPQTMLALIGKSALGSSPKRSQSTIRTLSWWLCQVVLPMVLARACGKADAQGGGGFGAAWATPLDPGTEEVDNAATAKIADAMTSASTREKRQRQRSAATWVLVLARPTPLDESFPITICSPAAAAGQHAKLPARTDTAGRDSYFFGTALLLDRSCGCSLARRSRRLSPSPFRSVRVRSHLDFDCL
jgi:hypothetical protein